MIMINTVKVISNVRRPQIKKSILWTLKIKKAARDVVLIDILELNQSAEFRCVHLIQEYFIKYMIVKPLAKQKVK